MRVASVLCGIERGITCAALRARQVREAQVAAFNHRPPQLINGHAEAKISPRPPLIYDRGAPVSRMHGTGPDNRACKWLLPLKVPNLRGQLGGDGRSGNLLVMVTFSLWDPLIPISC